MSVDWNASSTWNDPLIGGRTSADHWGRYPGGATKSIRVPGWFDWPHGFQMRGDYTVRESRNLNIGLSKSIGLVSNLILPAGTRIAIIGAGFGPTVEGLNLLGMNAIGTDISDFIFSKITESEEGDCRAAISDAGYDPDTHIIYAFGRDSSHNLTPFGFTLRSDPRPNRGGRFLWGINALDLMVRDRRGLTGRGPDSKIIDEDGSSNASRRRIANSVGGNLDFIISEYVLAGLDDDEALKLCQMMARMSNAFGGTVIHLVNIKRENNRGHPDMNWKLLPEWRALLDTNGFQTQQLRINEKMGAA